MAEPTLSPGRKIRTMADLGRLAGVSAATISRALADSKLVSSETRARIRALAEQHSFRPNQLASRLRTQRTGVIGIVVPLGHEKRQHLSDPFFMTLLGHLADLLTENEYDVMLSRVIPDKPDWLERIVSSGMHDGVLVIGQSDQFDAIERTARDYRPLVVWGSHIAGQVHCAVGVDNRLGGRMVGERLISRGCRRLAFMGEVRTLELAERHGGLVEAAAAAGLPVPLQLNTHLASDIMDREIAAHLERWQDDIDGIAAASDVIASTATRVLAHRGFKVPDDIPVTGFDDLPLATQTTPGLTTIRQDLAAGSKAMIAALFARIAGENASSVEMTPVLVERGSA